MRTYILPRIYNRLFSVDRISTIGALTFNHCSTVSSRRIGKSTDGTVVAWYTGTSEAAPDQHIRVRHYDTHGRMSETVVTGNAMEATGNPVLWRYNELYFLLYCQFENADKYSPVDRWKHCSLWLQRLVYDPKKRTIIKMEQPQQLTTADQHLLGRCSPLLYGREVILPLYDELTTECSIWVGDPVKLDFEEVSRFGTNQIQPTIWAHRNKICCLSRNIHTPRKTSVLRYSADGCRTWGKEIKTNIYCQNNSLQVLSDLTDDYLVWNDTPKGRSNLTFGKILHKKNSINVEKLLVVSSEHGAYPSIVKDELGMIHLTYTNGDRQIVHRQWNTKYLRALEKSKSLSNQSQLPPSDHPKSETATQ